MTPGQRVGRLRVEKKSGKKKKRVEYFGGCVAIRWKRNAVSVDFRVVVVVVFFFLFSFRPQPLTAITDNKIPSTRNDNRQRTENKTIDR